MFVEEHDIDLGVVLQEKLRREQGLPPEKPVATNETSMAQPKV